MKSIIIGTRASKLAMAQTNGIAARLRQQWPDLEIRIEQISTKGDRVTNIPLSAFGGDGVFITEIERALQERRIDLAVHSLKDLPTAQPEGLWISAVGPREDVRDLLVSDREFEIDPTGHLLYQQRLRIGTCSLRRTAQLHALVPDVEILPLRGNVDTRLRKLEAGDYDGIVLAAAGLHRLGLQERLEGKLTYLPIDRVLPAPGQGAIAIEMRNEPEINALVAPICDEQVSALAGAERQFMRRLGAGCYLPVAAYAEMRDGLFSLSGLVISLDGQQQVRVHQSVAYQPEAQMALAELLGLRAAEQALKQGADQIIEGLGDGRVLERQRV